MLKSLWCYGLDIARIQNFKEIYMKKSFLLLLSLVVLLPGCMGSKKEKTEKSSSSKKTHMTKVDIPLGDDGIRSFFDEDIQEFTLAEDNATQEDTRTAKEDPMELVDGDQDFSWVEETTVQDGDLQVAYFEFDSAVIKPEQSKKIDENIQVIKEELAQAKKDGQEAVVSVQGHSCHSAGSVAYNLVKSEERAKIVADRLQMGGISKDKIKVVGYGSEVPTIADGQKVTGNRKQQWANRRVEFNMVTI